MSLFDSNGLGYNWDIITLGDEDIFLMVEVPNFMRVTNLATDTYAYSSGRNVGVAVSFLKEHKIHSLSRKQGTGYRSRKNLFEYTTKQECTSAVPALAQMWKFYGF